MKILIAVPSKRRAETLAKYTMKWLPLVGSDYKIFVEKEDLDSYAQVVPNEQIIVLPDSNRGLGFSKSIIRKYAETHGYDTIAKIDDDIQGWTEFRKRLDPEQSALKFIEILQEVDKMFDNDADTVVISFPYAFQMFEQKRWSKSKRVQTCFITRIEYFHGIPELSVFEDFAVGVNAIVKGKKVMMYGNSGQILGVQVGKGAGGLQSFNRKNQTSEAIQILQKMYPALTCRKVDKDWDFEPDLRSVKGVFYP